MNNKTTEREICVGYRMTVYVKINKYGNVIARL